MLSTTLRPVSYPASSRALDARAAAAPTGKAQQQGGVQPTAAAGAAQQQAGAQPAAAASKAQGQGSAQPTAAGPAGKDEDKAKAEEIRKLKARDAEVRAHELAHATAGGAYAGAPSYGFQRGPDGQSYAVSGEVPIDVSDIAGDPQATITKMQQVKRAALAPQSPSGADRSIAATADAKIAAARTELFQKNTTGAKSDASGANPAGTKSDAKAAATGDASGAHAASASAAGAHAAATSADAESPSAGDRARELIGVLAQRNAGLSAYGIARAGVS